MHQITYPGLSAHARDGAGQTASGSALWLVEWAGSLLPAAGMAQLVALLPGHIYVMASLQAHVCPIRSRTTSKFRKVPVFLKGLQASNLFTTA